MTTVPDPATRPALPPDVEAELRRVAAETGEDYRYVRDLHNALLSMDEEEELDATEGRDPVAELTATIAEIDTEQAAAALAVELRAGASTPCKLAAVDLLAGAGWLTIPGLPITTDRRSIRWDRMRVADTTGWLVDEDDSIGMDLTVEQVAVHDLAVSLATGEPVDMREVLATVAWDSRLSRLVLDAVRTALAPMPAGGAR